VTRVYGGKCFKVSAIFPVALHAPPWKRPTGHLRFQPPSAVEISPNKYVSTTIFLPVSNSRYSRRPYGNGVGHQRRTVYRSTCVDNHKHDGAGETISRRNRPLRDNTANKITREQNKENKRFQTYRLNTSMFVLFLLFFIHVYPSHIYIYMCVCLKNVYQIFMRLIMISDELIILIDSIIIFFFYIILHNTTFVTIDFIKLPFSRVFKTIIFFPYKEWSAD